MSEGAGAELGAGEGAGADAGGGGGTGVGALAGADADASVSALSGAASERPQAMNASANTEEIVATKIRTSGSLSPR
jgi:hypothetical protein